MKEEELVRQLESTTLPDIRVASHQGRLKMGLLSRGYSRKQQETAFLEEVTASTTGVMNTVSGVLVARRTVWKVALTSTLAVLVLIVAFFSIPQTSALIKSAFFSGGSRTISGTQLNVDDQRASDILMADPRIQELLAQGAVIDKILPIQVVYERVNPETGKTETIEETWAQAWLVLGDKDWGVQIDMVKGQIVSITP